MKQHLYLVSLFSFFTAASSYSTTTDTMMELKNKGSKVFVQVRNGESPIKTSAGGTTFEIDKGQTVAFNGRIDAETKLYVYLENPELPSARPFRVYGFERGKKILVTWNGKILYPQTGRAKGWLGKTDSGISLKNNVTAEDIRQLESEPERLTMAKASASGAYNNATVVEEVFSKRSLSEENPRDLFARGDSQAKGLVGWFVPDATADILLSLLADEYRNRANRKKLDPRDVEILKTFKANLNGMYLHMPVLTYLNPYSSMFPRAGVYEIQRFKSVRIGDETIKFFLRLLLGGAHFVILGESNLLSDVRTLPQSGKNYKHSHYNQTDARTVFPDITWSTRDPAPIVDALLIDKIVIDDQDVGTFFQLEGWPVHKDSDVSHDMLYHGVDFALHKATVWNISTYGMSPYSEKRGTSVFITKEKDPPSKRAAVPTFASDYRDYAVDERW